MLGVVLFGSVARCSDTASSDIDLLLVVADMHRDAAAAAVTALARDSTTHRIAASCDSYSRLRHFIDLGDPFVRTIFAEGVILHDTSGLLAELIAACRDQIRVPEHVIAAQYLHAKAVFHHRRVHEHLYELLGDLQLSLMARAQAIALLSDAAPTPDTFVLISRWSGLVDLLRANGIDEEIINTAQALVNAHKVPSSDELFGEFTTRFSSVAERLARTYDMLTSRLPPDGDPVTSSG